MYLVDFLKPVPIYLRVISLLLYQICLFLFRPHEKKLRRNFYQFYITLVFIIDDNQ